VGSTSALTAGVAELLAANGVGVWRPTGMYAAGELGIFDSIVPASPDRIITLTVYGADDDPTQADSTARMQLRTRGDRDPRTSADLQDAAFDVLHNLPRQQIGGITVAGCWRRSASYLGADGNGRHSHTSNYEIRLHRPAPHRT
jgi:hypothetical protein